MSFEFVRLEPHDARDDFTCDDDDLDEFYKKDSIGYALQLISVTYAVREDGRTVGFFSLSNDALRKDPEEPTAFNKISRKIPNEKRHPSMPAAKIGRLGVCTDKKGMGVGTHILDFLKYSFTHNNKTGCRILLVDSYIEATGFYKKNGFNFLIGNEPTAKTRIMYFDLATFRDPTVPIKSQYPKPRSVSV